MTETLANCCPLCNEPAHLIRRGFSGYRAPDTYDINGCDKCDLQFASPFKSDPSIYDAIYARPDLLSGYARYLEYRRAVLGARDPLGLLASSEPMYWFVAATTGELNRDRSKKILEVGCGLGYLTYALKQAGHDASGLDISERAIADAKRSFGDHYICADVNVMSAQAAGSFDIVVMTEVLEHLDAPLSVLRSIHALLRPGGVALVSTPNKDFLPPDAVWRTDNPPVHLAWYSRTSLREMARRTNFHVRFADFSVFNQGQVAGIDGRRDLASGSGAFRLSPSNQPLDALPPPRGTASLVDRVPGLRRLLRRRKYVRRALELYAPQSEVLGVILERPAGS